MKANDENKSATTALAATANQGMTALQVVQNEGSIQKIGQLYAASQFFGKVSASTATAAIVNCFLEGLSPVQYRAKYHTFDNGQTGIKSDYIQREFHKLGGEWKFVEWSPNKCDMVFTYKGQSLNLCVTIDEFKANGVAMDGDGKSMKSNWKKFPREMLKARCMATAIRAICPEALEGLYTQEEVQDSDRPSAPRTVVESVSKSSVPKETTSALQQAGGGAKDDAKDEADYGICPCGSVKGERWEALPTATLEIILATPKDKAPLLTDAHRNAIVDELGRREAATNGEVVEAEVVD